MKITQGVKELLVKKFGIGADASEDDFKKCLTERVAAGELSLDEIGEASKAKSVGSSLDAKIAEMVAAGITKAMSMMQVPAPAAPAPAPAPAPAVTSPTPSAQPGDAAKALALASAGGSAATFEATPEQVRVKSVVERFNHVPSNVTYDQSDNPFIAKAFGGRQATSGIGSTGYSLERPTDRTKAIVGAWFKLKALKAFRAQGMAVPPQFQMNEQDRQLCLYAAHECKFVGPIGYKGGQRDSDGADYWCEGEKLSNDLHVKTLLDDSTSGGLEAVPIEFDAAVILTPVLNGELFPLVTVNNVSRRRIEATAVGNPTMSWGGASGTPISLFDTDGFISAFDTNIYVIDGAMELGRDFLSDSPLDIGGIVQDRYGEVFRRELDNVIATGNGTNQPEGLFNAAGVTVITPAGGAGTAPQVGDYEQLIHGIAKEYQQEAGMPPNSRMVLIGTQTSYQRSRSIPVDSSNDARRIFGQDNQFDYRLMGLRYAINSSLTNAQIGCFCMNRYRMYRRAGLEVAVAAGDVQSLRRNTQTIVLRARFGGALEKSAAGTKMTAAQA